MDWKSLALAILTPIVAAGLKFILNAIGFQLDDATFNAFVIAIVTYLVSLVFAALGDAGLKKMGFRGFLNEG